LNATGISGLTGYTPRLLSRNAAFWCAAPLAAPLFNASYAVISVSSAVLFSLPMNTKSRRASAAISIRPADRDAERLALAFSFSSARTFMALVFFP